MRKPVDYIIIALKGMGIGAADVVPGVSGGTIAFISGIYEELIKSIKNFDGQALKQLLHLKLGLFWKKINGNFLGSLVAGIALSIFSLAKLMSYLLNNHPVLTWSFFFGLIIASTFMIGREIPRWNIKTICGLIIGAAAAYFVTVATPASTPDSWWFIIICGAVASCAMILPGISGAFILLLLSKYPYIMDAVSNYRAGIILLFVAGAVVGLISFSHFLSWLLNNYRAVTMAVLTGFLFGSLNKVWPWKKVLEWYTDSHGQAHPLVEENVLPGVYTEIYGTPSHLWGAVGLMAVGLLLIMAIEGTGKRVGKKKGGKTA